MENMNEWKEEYARDTEARTLSDALAGADVLIGLSVAGAVSPGMVALNGENPIVFAMANPDPEIPYPDAVAARSDTVIMGTGRSDFPNQVNNVLGFPFIFRGALDVRAKAINMEMKLAATRGVGRPGQGGRARQRSESIRSRHDAVRARIHHSQALDSRVLMWVAPAVAKAAMETGVARRTIDLDNYLDELALLIGKGVQVMRTQQSKAKKNPKRVVFGEGENPEDYTRGLCSRIGRHWFTGAPGKPRNYPHSLRGVGVGLPSDRGQSTPGSQIPRLCDRFLPRAPTQRGDTGKGRTS